MKRWVDDLELKEVPDADAFLADVIAVCRKHDMSLSFDEGPDAFIVRRGFDESCAEQLNDAHFESR